MIQDITEHFTECYVFQWCNHYYRARNKNSRIAFDKVACEWTNTKLKM